MRASESRNGDCFCMGEWTKCRKGREKVIDIMKIFLYIGCCLFLLSGCGSLTGIPGHGGGKRFAVEQELVAAATRATIKKIDLSAIRGKKVNLFLNAIDDTGSGNLVGGRFSVVSQIRGDYIHSPQVTEKSYYPRYNSTSTTSSSSESESDTSSSNGSESSSSNSSSSTSTTSTSSLLASPEKKTTEQEGSGSEVNVGVEYNGLGAYQNSEEISSSDMQYLSGLLQTYLFLQGVHIVPPSEADIDVYVTVDVFGTVRTRVDWFFANNEILCAKTALEIMAVEHDSGNLVMKPQSATVEAEYNEQYLLWIGPIMIRKYLKTAQPLLTDYTQLDDPVRGIAIEQDEQLQYPFRHQVEKWKEESSDTSPENPFIPQLQDREVEQ